MGQKTCIGLSQLAVTGESTPLARSVRKLERPVTQPLAARLIHWRSEIGGVDRIFGHYALLKYVTTIRLHVLRSSPMNPHSARFRR
jgi:hypothetical protein